jgi:hypothetical protein
MFFKVAAEEKLRISGTKKPAAAGFFYLGTSLEHGARRYIFKGFAVVFEHAFQDFAQFHGCAPVFNYAGVARYALII